MIFHIGAFIAALKFSVRLDGFIKCCPAKGIEAAALHAVGDSVLRLHTNRDRAAFARFIIVFQPRQSGIRGEDLIERQP
ncbi:hypothetical protein SDC9_163520 [bioreactor metagenome]|uniref:Uncharacterized protein n=1 Tax=bioreactor metagenome TaxID=1076179 RepID=A0A645FRD9_9ZZZZ